MGFIGCAEPLYIFGSGSALRDAIFRCAGHWYAVRSVPTPLTRASVLRSMYRQRLMRADLDGTVRAAHGTHSPRVRGIAATAVADERGPIVVLLPAENESLPEAVELAHWLRAFGFARAAACASAAAGAPLDFLASVVAETAALEAPGERATIPPLRLADVEGIVRPEDVVTLQQIELYLLNQELDVFESALRERRRLFEANRRFLPEAAKA